VLLRNNVEWNERTARYLQIRRCSSCRLRRCFEMGMKEELVRTEAENERHRQLVSLNRKRRDILKQPSRDIIKLSIPQVSKIIYFALEWRKTLHMKTIIISVHNIVFFYKCSPWFFFIFIV
jgi:hypothetical protein